MRSLLVLILFVPQTTCFAQDRAAIVRGGKAATALVDLRDQELTATAFCIVESGIFVTNFHVVKKLDENAEVRLVLNAGLEDQQELTATVIRIDEENDLALLRTKKRGKFPVLPLGSVSELFETQQLTVFGFPFGKGLSAKEDSYPEISVNVGRITSLRRGDKKRVKYLQLDADINPGNSGGAVLNEKGEVVGVVSFGIQASGVNFAIPVSKLSELVARPDVQSELPTIADLGKEPLKVTVTPFGDEIAMPTVEVIVTVGDDPAVTVPLQRKAGNEFESEFTPAKPLPEFVLSVEATFESGRLSGTVSDREYTIDGKKKKLSETEQLQRDPNTGDMTVVLNDGQTLTGAVGGLTDTRLNFGPATSKVDLGKVTELRITPPENQPSVKYEVVVRSGADEIYRSKVEDAGGLAEPVVKSISTVRPYTGGKKTLKLPGTITDATLAGGGRYLLLTLGESQKLAVYDLDTATIRKVISLPSTNVLVAGLLEHALVVDRNRNIISRYSLTSFKSDRSSKPPFQGIVKAIAGGYASEGPVLIHWSSGTAALDRAVYGFMDIDSMKLRDVTLEGRLNNTSYRDVVHMRASASGSVYGMWATSHSPQGLEVLIFSGDRAFSKREHTSVGHVVPGPDGMYLFTGIGGVYSSSLVGGDSRRNRVPCVPTTHPRLYVTVPAEPGAQRNLGNKPFDGVKPGLFQVDSDTPLINLPSLELGKSNENRSWMRGDFTLDKRVYYILGANQLISIPLTNDRLVIQRVSLMESLKESGVDYFFVVSTPKRGFRPGKTYRYRIEVASKRPGVRFSLAESPKGMRISPSGDITWKVPSQFRDDKAEVIVNITNSIDQHTVEAFTLYRSTD